MNPQYRAVLDGAFARSALLDATDPTHARAIAADLEMPYARKTRSDVEDQLGPEVADAWAEVREAIEQYNAAVEARIASYE